LFLLRPLPNPLLEGEGDFPQENKYFLEKLFSC